MPIGVNYIMLFNEKPQNNLKAVYAKLYEMIFYYLKLKKNILFIKCIH